MDTDLEGYVFKDYMKTEVSFNEAVSLEEEQQQEAEAEERRKEAEEALAELEKAKEEAKKATTTAAAPETTKAAETTKAETTKAETTSAAPETRPQVIEANPESDGDTTAAAPETERETETTTQAETQKVQEGPGSSSDAGSSSAVTSATRNAIVAYAKQFLGNPYVYGGTSLTNGADCSGFVMSVFAHFGISTGRSSRDQAAKGREIPVSEVQPGDLLFYASGNYINHVGIYVGGGQIIHSSTPATGICYAPSNYRTPCKAVTFLD